LLHHGHGRVVPSFDVADFNVEVENRAVACFVHAHARFFFGVRHLQVRLEGFDQSLVIRRALHKVNLLRLQITELLARGFVRGEQGFLFVLRGLELFRQVASHDAALRFGELELRIADNNGRGKVRFLLREPLDVASLRCGFVGALPEGFSDFFRFRNVRLLHPAKLAFQALNLVVQSHGELDVRLVLRVRRGRGGGAVR